MKGLTDKQYNKVLKEIYLLEVERKLHDFDFSETEPRSRETNQAKELLYINKHIIRHYNSDDMFIYADFETSIGNFYRIKRDGELYRIKGMDLIPVKCSVKDLDGWFYRALQIVKRNADGTKNVCTLEFHLLMMTCAYDNFLDIYLENKSFVVNHKIITDIKENRHNNFDSVDNLEMITQSDNKKAGYFVRDYGLLDLSVESIDIPILKSILIDLNTVNEEKRSEIEALNRWEVYKYYSTELDTIKKVRYAKYKNVLKEWDYLYENEDDIYYQLYFMANENETYKTRRASKL